MFKIYKPFPGANTPRTIRFTEELFEKLNKIAQENEISFNMLVLQCCDYAVSQLEQEAK